MIEIPCFLADPQVFLEDIQTLGHLPTVDFHSVAVTLPDSRDYGGLAQTCSNIIFLITSWPPSPHIPLQIAAGLEEMPTKNGTASTSHSNTAPP